MARVVLTRVFLMSVCTKTDLADDLPIAVPDDFHKIVGFKLPRSLCFLVARRTSFVDV